MSNTRGTILVHPAIDALQPGHSTTIGWTMFWHQGWKDFFAQALRRSPQMVRIDATNWTSFPGEAAFPTFQGRLGETPLLHIDKQAIPLRRSAAGWQAEIASGEPGERVATLRYGNGLATRAVLNTVPDLRTTLTARTRFIAQRQQWRKAGDPWDGAYIVFDNDAGVPARWERSSDRNSGRERSEWGCCSLAG